MTLAVLAVSFDFGQTLAELDYDFLRQRLAERGASLVPSAARQATEEAWQKYGASKLSGHAAAWRAMIEALLRAGGVPEARRVELAEWLWQEQPKQNLWRRPIPGMIELVAELVATRLPVCIISNSEGRLQELVAELRWTELFEPILDSGKLGIDKPDPRIFRHACQALRVAPEQLLHVGDSWQADVEGALAVGARAVWFAQQHREKPLPGGVFGAADALELRRVFERLSVLGARGPQASTSSAPDEPRSS